MERGSGAGAAGQGRAGGIGDVTVTCDRERRQRTARRPTATARVTKNTKNNKKNNLEQRRTTTNFNFQALPDRHVIPSKKFDETRTVRRNFADRGLSFYLNDDPGRNPLIEDLSEFLHLRQLTHNRYHPYLITKFFAHLGKRPTRPIHRAILNGLFKELQNIFRQLATDTPPLLDYVNTVYAQSQHISSELESEITRVEMAYDKIPWWDSHPFVGVFAHGILGVRRQRKMFTKYHEFLSTDGTNIRYLVEQIAILHDHLEILQQYFRWYSDGPIIIVGFYSFISGSFPLVLRRRMPRTLRYLPRLSFLNWMMNLWNEYMQPFGIHVMLRSRLED
ncbi:hypothetical protein ARMSODRAFT_1038153 [Armillaria solidipes]|uniref:Uncharacterized protein n=1 Tax=Armillaria solidipes TaxID=1076256 RepID=A0A2H3BZY4_9AGAR|nr:hypothetical protein ARMSODRAFT_1038153 [Armillaria solidipes]